MICTLAVALLLPKVSAVVMDVIPSIQSAVICVGDRLIVVRLNADGQPIEEPDAESAPCVMSNVVTAFAQADQDWVLLARSYVRVFQVRLNAFAIQDRMLDDLPQRAPPVVI